MSEHSSRFGPAADPDPRPVPGAIDHDLDALRSVTSQHPPGLTTSLRAAQRRATGAHGEGFTMAIRSLSRRPALATVLGVVVAAVGLLAIPVSFERTVGYDVALTLGGANVAQSQVAEIARELSETLGGQGARVEATMEDGRMTYVLETSAKGDVRGAAGAFAKQLTALGYTAAVTTRPRKETVSGNMYAYAMSRVLQISTDGKSAAQIEAEIRDGLVSAGVTGAQVSVTDLGGDKRQIRLEAKHTGQPVPDFPELVLTRDGKPVEDAGCAVKVMKSMDGSGRLALTVTATVDGRATTVELPNAETMSDAAIAAAIESRLLAAGIDVVVKVAGDEITVEKRQK